MSSEFQVILVFFLQGSPLFDCTTALIRTPELGVQVAESLGERCGLPVKNHGSTVAGESIEVATLYAVLLGDSSTHFATVRGRWRSLVAV